MRDFKVCDDAMNHLGMSEDERFSVFTIVACVLHLGNIGFEENHEDTKGKLEFMFLAGCCYVSSLDLNVSLM